MTAAKEFSLEIGVLRACEAMGVSRATFYRERQGKGPAGPRPKPRRALSEKERQVVLEVCHSEEFVDRAPRAIQATHPERFSKGRPKPPKLPEPAWINPPKKEIAA